MQTELKVNGMHCMSCKNLIEEEIAEVPGVQSVRVDLAGARAALEYDETQVALATLIDKTKALGYQAEAA